MFEVILCLIPLLRMCILMKKNIKIMINITIIQNVYQLPKFAIVKQDVCESLVVKQKVCQYDAFLSII